MSAALPGVHVCQNRSCGQWGRVHAEPGSCEVCGLPRLEPMCPPWCDEHRGNARIEVSVFEHAGLIGYVQIADDQIMSARLCQAGDADSLGAPYVVLATEDPNYEVTSAETLRGIARLAERAAQAVDDVENGRTPSLSGLP